MQGVCLVAQQLRDKIAEGSITTTATSLARGEEGKFEDEDLENRIQSSSFEPIIGDELFILDAETNGIFRPQKDASVYRTLLQLPGRQRRRVDITGGFEVKKGFTYLVPLEETVHMGKDEFVKSSPKSSLGRMFLNTRMLADYNPCFDEINYEYNSEDALHLWLLLQPQAFNLILYPGLSLNHLRFFQEHNAQLTPAELIEELKNNPLLYTKVDGELAPAECFVTDALQIHLDLSGKDTQGIIGLRARHNPTPIDLKQKKYYEAEEFFEPLKGDEKITIHKGEYYLFASSEVLKIPKHLSVELKSHSHIGFTGPLHFAGFIDSGFEGDLVFEVRSDELSSMALEDGMPISKLDIFRNIGTDKPYSKKIGSNYKGQVGPCPPAYFKPFDFAFAARNYKKLDRLVLVQDAKILNSHRRKKEGFELLIADEAQSLYKDIERGFFQSRYDCESDELLLQPIPYVLLFGPNRTVFSYVRAKDIKEYGEKGLFGKHSIGLGGHIITADAPDYIEKCLQREVIREEVNIQGAFSTPKLVGVIMAYDTAVDRVHFCLSYVIHTDGVVQPNESSITSGKMIPIDALMYDTDDVQKYETWSKILIPHLSEIYDGCKINTL